MDNISDFEKRISSSMDRILKVLEKSDKKTPSVYHQSDEISHLEKIISKLEGDKEKISTDFQAASDEVINLNEKIENIMTSMNDEKLKYEKIRDELLSENKKIKDQLNSLRASRKDQINELNSILADLEPMLENTGEINA